MKKLLLIIPFLALTLLIADYRTDKLSDTEAQIVHDSIVAFSDTMEASPVLMNELQVIDSLYIPILNGTPSNAGVGIFCADTANDSLFFYLPGGKTALYPTASAGAMSGTDILDSLNDATRSVTQTWEWDGGDIIAADGQRFYWTDGTEADSGSIYDAGDTTHFTADNPIRIGGAGTTTVDSLEVQGVVEGNFQVRDSLIIPTYAAFPATGSEGLIGADSANDSLIAYWGAARRVIYPSAGGGADDWVSVIGLDWYGGGTLPVCDADDQYYNSSATDDDLWTRNISLPIEIDGDDVIIDSILIAVMTWNEVDDSVHFYFQSMTAPEPGTWTYIDSVWVGGGSAAYNTGNIIPNGDVTMVDGLGYRIYADCVNQVATAIRMGLDIRVVYHK